MGNLQRTSSVAWATRGADNAGWEALKYHDDDDVDDVDDDDDEDVDDDDEEMMMMTMDMMMMMTCMKSLFLCQLVGPEQQWKRRRRSPC